MDIGNYLEKFPQLETTCNELLNAKYQQMMGTEPLPEMQEYVMTIGVKSDSTRAVVFENFHVLFKDKTEQLVKYLFDSLALQITQMAQ